MYFRLAVLLTFLLSPFFGFGQFGPRQEVTSQTSVVEMAYGVDIDGDLDNDIVFASRGENSIGWIENIDGLGNFGIAQFIDHPGLQDVYYVEDGDLDGDNDIDLITGSQSQGMLYWYQNIDGLGNFSAPLLLNDEMPEYDQFAAVDIDGDFDLDILFSSEGANTIGWIENLNGNGDFGGANIISSNSTSTRAVIAADLDGDDDLDVIAAEAGRRIYWYRNLNGEGDFGSPNAIIELADPVGYHYLDSGDLDGDDDIDIAVVGYGGNLISWFENLNGEGFFGEQRILSASFPLPSMLSITDLDNDSDLDLLICSADFDNSYIAWLENIDGSGSFSDYQIISVDETSPRAAFSADLNGDVFGDIITSSLPINRISWYENLHTLSIEERTVADIALHPNPVKDLIQITTPIDVEQATIYDLSGRLVQVYNVVDKQINVSGLAAGVYLLNVEVDGMRFTNRFVKQ